MNGEILQESRNLIDFWDKAFHLSEEDLNEIRREGADSWKEMAPAAKLFQAAASLSGRKKVLDYGCGNAWAGIIAAKSGCPDVTAVDAAPGAVRAARFYAEICGAQEHMHIFRIDPDWLRTVPSGIFDGIICSNVLDVVPPEIAEEILRELARIAARGAEIIIGLNFHMSPEAAAQRHMELVDNRRLYVDGVLRLVSRSDEEWKQILASFFIPERLEHFAWPGESAETRRLFYLRKREEQPDTGKAE